MNNLNFDNFSIRILKPSDLEFFYHLIDNNRNRLEDFFAGIVAKTQSLKGTKQFITEIEQKITEKEYLPFIIIDTDTNNIIGYIDLKNIDWNIPKAEMGLFIDHAYQGKGISKKAFQLVTDHCFKHYNFHKLYLRTHATNSAVIAIAKHCGFQEEGHIRADYKTTRGEIVDLVYFGLLKTR